MDPAGSFIATIQALADSWKMTVTLSYSPFSEAKDDDQRWHISLGTAAVASGATAQLAVNALLAKLRLENEA